MTTPWYVLANAAEVPSPALLVFPDRAAENIRRMVARAGSVGRLRPHVKTHKLPEVLRMHLDAGVTAFKAATPAECEMAASAGAPDVLLAYQPVGPAASRLVALAQAFPQTRFSTVVDDPAAARALGAAAVAAGLVLDVCVDIDCGMHRTGVEPGRDAEALYALLATTPGLRPAGMLSRRRRCAPGEFSTCDFWIGVQPRIAPKTRTPSHGRLSGMLPEHLGRGGQCVSLRSADREPPADLAAPPCSAICTHSHRNLCEAGIFLPGSFPMAVLPYSENLMDGRSLMLLSEGQQRMYVDAIFAMAALDGFKIDCTTGGENGNRPLMCAKQIGRYRIEIGWSDEADHGPDAPRPCGK